MNHNKIPGRLEKKTDYDKKNIEIKNKIASITGLFSAYALSAKAIEIGNNIPDNANLAAKPAFTKAAEIENKIIDTSLFINTQELNRLEKISFDTKMKEVIMSLATKIGVSNALDLRKKPNLQIKIKFRLFPR